MKFRSRTYFPLSLTFPKLVRVEEQVDFLLESEFLHDGIVNLTQQTRDELFACVEAARVARLRNVGQTVENGNSQDASPLKTGGKRGKSEREEIFQCPSCNKSFNRKWNMARHMKQKCKDKVN